MAPFDTLGSVFDDLFQSVQFTPYGTSVRYVPTSPRAYEYSTYGTGSTSALPSNYPHTVEEAIKLIRSSGEDAEPFEKVKRAYGDLPSFPATDVSLDEGTGNIQIDIALPGYDEDDISINHESDMLIVEVRKKNRIAAQRKSTDTPRFYLNTGMKSSGTRLKIPMPSSHFDVDTLEATYSRGIVTITAARTEDTKPKRIQLKKS